jgi:uncharacterized protein (DUF2147 family)
MDRMIFKGMIIALALIATVIPRTAIAGDDPVFEADAILGIWETERDAEDPDDKWSHIEVYESDGKVHGRLVWLSRTHYPEDDERGMGGLPAVDRNNADESLRERPLLGADLMRNFKHNKKNKWEDGRIYDPENGKTYRCKLTLKDADTIELFGYIKVGFVKLGRNTTWVRLPKDPK